MAQKYEEYVPPVNPNTMDSIEVVSNFTNPERAELAVEILDRNRMIEEILSISSEIHSARNSEIDKLIIEFISKSDKFKNIFNSVVSIISGDIDFGNKKTDDLHDNITRSVMDHETAIGSMIFKGPDIDGDHTVFVSPHAIDEIFWYFKPNMPDASPVTVKYVLSEKEVKKSIDVSPFMNVDDQELDNLYSCVKMIHYIASRGVYKDSLRSDFDLAA